MPTAKDKSQPKSKPKAPANGGDTQLVSRDDVNSLPRAAVKAQLYNDWTGVNDDDRLKYVLAICKSLNIPTPLNPFRFIKVHNKTVLYAPNEAAQLIAERNRISTPITNKYLDKEQNIYVVEVRASNVTGRHTDNLGAIYVGGMSGPDRANSIMKCVTKAQRRTIFAMTGLSIVDDDQLTEMRREAANGAPAAAISPPSAAPALPDPTRQEMIEARAELFRALTGKGGLFERDPVQASRWVQDKTGKPFNTLNAVECEDLVAEASNLMKDEGEVEEQQTTQPAQISKPGSIQGKGAVLGAANAEEQSELFGGEK